MKLKTFKDLVFEAHSDDGSTDGFFSKINFDNGWGISVIRFKCKHLDPFVISANFFRKHKNSKYDSLTNNEDEWEVGILKNGELCYKNPFHSDAVKGYLLEKDVTELMIKMQEYKD